MNIPISSCFQLNKKSRNKRFDSFSQESFYFTLNSSSP